jgi:hypothetical protein
MPVRTISNTGGNWNATGTWVEGAIPTSSDNLVATATSGPLTVTANASINGVNFTNYTNTFTINSGVTLTQGAGSATSQPFTFVAGMTVAGTGTLSFNGTFTMTSGGKVWTGNLTFAPQGGGSNRTITLGDNWTIDGNLSFIPGTANLQQVVNGAGISITTGGNLISTGVQIISGTALINVTSPSPTISLQGGALFAGRFGLSLTINSSGTVTFSTANISYGGAGRTFTHTSGTIVFSFPNSNWYSVSGTTTYSLNSTTFPFPNFTVTANPIFAGSQGASFISYTSTTAGLTHTFASSRTYTISSGITLTGTNASRISFVSSIASTQAVLTVLQGATIDVGYANATDIDSSLGQTVWSYRGTLLRTNNWQQLPTQPRTVASFNI